MLYPFWEIDKHIWSLLIPRSSALIQNVKRQSGRSCIHVIDAVLMVTRGHEMVEKDLLQNLAPTGIFFELLNDNLCFI